MGKRGLYSTLSTKQSDIKVKLMMDILSFSDGENSLVNIAENLMYLFGAYTTVLIYLRNII